MAGAVGAGAGAVEPEESGKNNSLIFEYSYRRLHRVVFPRDLKTQTAMQHRNERGQTCGRLQALHRICLVGHHAGQAAGAQLGHVAAGRRDELRRSARRGGRSGSGGGDNDGRGGWRLGGRCGA